MNKDPVNPFAFDFAALGGACREMRIHTVNGPSPDSYNDIGRDEVGITASEWLPFEGKITLPPHSVNVVEIK